MAKVFLVAFEPQQPGMALNTKILGAMQGMDSSIQLTDTCFVVEYSGGDAEKLWHHIEKFVSKTAWVYVLPLTSGWFGRGEKPYEEWLKKHVG